MKSKIFWGMIIATVLMTVITYFVFKDDGILLEKNFVSDLSFLSFIIASFIALFNSSEFSERYSKK